MSGTSCISLLDDFFLVLTPPSLPAVNVYGFFLSLVLGILEPTAALLDEVDGVGLSTFAAAMF